MRSSTVVKLVLQLLWTRGILTATLGTAKACSNRFPNYTWFCDQHLPLVERSADGSFQTEFLRAAEFRPLEFTSGLVHSIFVTPGVQYHCMELAVRCGSTKSKGNHMRTVQLIFRCDRLLTTYIAYHNGAQDYYHVLLEHTSHQLWNINPGCTSSFSRFYQLFGDGYHYMLVTLCHSFVVKRKSTSIAYWLFVNKRNTPQQNRHILEQLALLEPNLFKRDVRRRWLDGLDEGDKNGCRCDVFERYITSVKRCTKPFLTSDTVVETGIKEGHVPTDDPDTPDEVAKNRIRWFVYGCLVVATSFGIILYALFLHLHSEEIITQE